MLGTWTAGTPSMMFDWESNEMEDKASLFKAKKIYKVVSVIQPPFMQWNDTKSKIPASFVVRFLEF